MTIKPGEIVIKDPQVLVGLMERRFSPLLITIISQVAKDYGLTITESYREPRHSGDVHSTQPVRAVDLRSWDYPPGVAGRITNEINSRWSYDPARPEMLVAQIHEVKGGGLPCHIQVHPNTVRRSNG